VAGPDVALRSQATETASLSRQIAVFRCRLARAIWGRICLLEMLFGVRWLLGS